MRSSESLTPILTVYLLHLIIGQLCDLIRHSFSRHVLWIDSWDNPVLFRAITLPKIFVYSKWYLGLCHRMLSASLGYPIMKPSIFKWIHCFYLMLTQPGRIFVFKLLSIFNTIFIFTSTNNLNNCHFHTLPLNNLLLSPPNFHSFLTLSF